jgi:hypothetical protein
MNEVEKKLLATLAECAKIAARYCNETGMKLGAALSIVHFLAEHEMKETDELPEDELSNH